MSHRTGTPHGDALPDRQMLLDRRGERQHPKRHRTAKRKSRASAAKLAAGKRKAAANRAKQRAKFEKVRAYWRGEAPDLGGPR